MTRSNRFAIVLAGLLLLSPRPAIAGEKSFWVSVDCRDVTFRLMADGWVSISVALEGYSMEHKCAIAGRSPVETIEWASRAPNWQTGTILFRVVLQRSTSLDMYGKPVYSWETGLLKGEDFAILNRDLDLWVGTAKVGWKKKHHAQVMK